MAGQAEAAFHYSLAAGEAALRVAAASEALVHFEKARDLVPEGSLDGSAFGPQLRELYRQLGQAYKLAGQPAQATAAYAELAKLDPKTSGRGRKPG